jgi:recombinational DNA repair protein (RecF pathway)
VPSREPLTLPALHVATVPVGESDALVQLFCPGEGAVHVKARGLQKPQAKLAGALKPADELAVTLAATRGTSRILTGVSTSHAHPHWRADLGRLAFVWYMAECAFVGSGPPQLNDSVYQLAVNLLRTTPTADELPGAASAFALKLLALHGLLPDLEHCVVDACVLPAGQPAFLLPSGEGLIGREAYNRSYARGSVGLTRLDAARLTRWRRLLHGPLLEYGRLGADMRDVALLCGQLTRQLANLANRPIGSMEFLSKQWKLPSQRELLDGAG